MCVYVYDLRLCSSNNILALVVFRGNLIRLHLQVRIVLPYGEKHPLRLSRWRIPIVAGTGVGATAHHVS